MNSVTASLFTIIRFLASAFSLLLVVYVVLSYFMDPYHPVRLALGRIMEPLLRPIRRILPQTGGIDFSPLVLLILIQVLELILLRIVMSLASATVAGGP